MRLLSYPALALVLSVACAIPVLAQESGHGIATIDGHPGVVSTQGAIPGSGNSLGGSLSGTRPNGYDKSWVGYHAVAGPGAYGRTGPHGVYGFNYNGQYRVYGNPDLFYNHYVGNNFGGPGAALYLSPRPVPPWVGNTYITYQPLMPHEMMYHHHRTYHRYYNNGTGLTRTHVKYR